jgi:hypothetical protein
MQSKIHGQVDVALEMLWNKDVKSKVIREINTKHTSNMHPLNTRSC